MHPDQTLTKAELTRLVGEHVNVELGQLKGVVQAVFDVMKDSLKRGQRIEIRGFGSFGVKQRKGRNGGINPFTHEKMGKLPDHSVVVFKSGRVLKELVWNLKNE